MWTEGSSPRGLPGSDGLHLSLPAGGLAACVEMKTHPSTSLVLAEREGHGDLPGLACACFLGASVSAHNGMARSASRILGVARAASLVSMVSRPRMAGAAEPRIPPMSPQAGCAPSGSGVF